MSSTVAADETTDKRSIGINEVLLLEDGPYKPTITFTIVTCRIKLSLNIWMTEVITLLLFAINFCWRLSTPMNLRKSQKLKQAKGNVSSNMGKMLCGVYLFMITLVLVTDPHAAMELEMDTVSSTVTLPFAKRVVPAVPAVPIVVVTGDPSGDLLRPWDELSESQSLYSLPCCR